MENTFNTTLKALRKGKGITQEQLADAVGVSAQAVSKWEMSSLPDPSLLPAIADYLEVTIDELFGRKKEEEPDILTRLVRYLKAKPDEEKFKTIMDVCYSFSIACCGGNNFEPVPEHVYKNQDKVGGNFTEITKNAGFFQGRILENLEYFLIMPEPEKGYDYVLDYKEEYVNLFRFLAIPNALRAMYFLVGRSGSMFFNAETFVRELNVTKENAEEIVNGMNEMGFLWNADFNVGNSSERIYQCIPKHDFVSFMTFVHVLIHHPNSFNYQSNARLDAPFFKNDTYKYTPKSQDTDKTAPKE